MTTDNGTTAVADPEVTPPVKDESAQIGTDTVAAVVPDATTEGSVEAEPDDSFDADKFISAKLGTPTEEPVKPAPQYGKTQAEVELEAFNLHRNNTNALLRDGDRDVQDFVRNQLGLDPETSDRLWKEKVRPLIQQAANMPQIAVNQLFTEDLQQALPPESYNQLWESGKRYANRGEVLKQAIADTEARKDKEWESKKGKEWVPTKLAKEMAEEAATKAVARAERQIREGITGSGQNVNGRATGSGKSDAELLADPNTPIAKIQEIRARQKAGQ